VQGYYFSKPVPPHLLAGLLVTGIPAAAPPDPADPRPSNTKES
jgi:hypothetical protein